MRLNGQTRRQRGDSKRQNIYNLTATTDAIAQRVPRAARDREGPPMSTGQLPSEENTSNTNRGGVSRCHAIDVLEIWAERWFGPLPSPRAVRRRPSNGGPSRPRRRPAQRSIDMSEPQAAAENDVPSSSSVNVVQSMGSLVRHLSLPREVPLSAAEAQRQAAIIQELPGIGTWAGRQRLFTRPPERQQPPALLDDQDPPQLEEATSSGELEPSIMAEGALLPGDKLNAVGGDIDGNSHENGNGHFDPAQLPDPAPSPSANSDTSEALHEAWMWRFSRKWEAEQRRAMEEPPTTREPDGDGEIDAIEYFQACGVGVDLQVNMEKRPMGARAKSRNIDAAVGLFNGGAGGVGPNGTEPPFALCHSVSASTIQFEVDPSFASAGMLAAEASESFSATGLDAAGLGTPGGGGGLASPAAAGATRELLDAAGRGRALMARQVEIESEASAMWEQSCSSGLPWAGMYLPPVHIEMFGRFLYLVLRVTEPGGGRQRFLIRGKQCATRDNIVTEANAQAAAVCAEHKVPLPAVEVVGGGWMEWRSDTDRHLLLSPSATPLGATKSSRGGVIGHGSPPEQPTDVSGLAASLVRQALPCHFQISCQNANGLSSFGSLALN